MTKKELIKSSDAVINTKVKVAGTNYDRRRKVTKDMSRRMNQMYEAGKSLSTIAERFDVSPDTVRRTVDPAYNEREKARKRELQVRNNYQHHYSGEGKDLANYKRSLLESNKRIVISL